PGGAQLVQGAGELWIAVDVAGEVARDLLIDAAVAVRFVDRGAHVGEDPVVVEALLALLQSVDDGGEAGDLAQREQGVDPVIARRVRANALELVEVGELLAAEAA